MAKIVFEDSNAREQLESIIHPRVRDCWQAKISEWRKQRIRLGVVVIPLLFEVEVQDQFDVVLCVACSANTQRARLRQRNWGEGQISARVASQMDIVSKMNLTDHVLWNEGCQEVLAEQIDAILP